MSLYEFGRIIYRNWVYLITIPVAVAALVMVFTINQSKQYASSALVYTGIASGFNIESGTADKVDYHAVNNAFDNIISIIQSKQTLEEVLLRLLAHHLVRYKNGSPIPEPFQAVIETLTEDQKLRYVHNGLQDSTFLNLRNALSNNDPVLVKIIRSETGPYTIKSLQTLEVKRHKSSDMLILYYVSEYPEISKAVLEFVIKAFTARYRAIKVAETDDVVAYFQRQLDLAQTKLNDAEDRLTTFRTNSRVINYGEQTKAIAIKRQNALEEYFDKKMNILATQEALEELENKLEFRENLLATNGTLLENRDRLSSLVQDLATAQVSNQDTSRIQDLKRQIELVKTQIQLDMQATFTYSNSREGLPIRQLLNQWLYNVIELNR